MSTALSLEQFKQAMPVRIRKHVSTDVMDGVNKILADPIMHDVFKENLLSYASVMQDGRFKLDDYVRGIKYMSFRLMGQSNIQAWSATHPDRYQELVNKNTENRHIASIASAYSKGKLITALMEQSLIPTHLVNQGLYQDSINRLAYLMMNAASEKVQGDAAAKLADVLKAPESQKIELEIGIRENTAIQELRETTLALAAKQTKLLESGVMNAKEIAHSKLARSVPFIEADYVEVE